MQIRIAENQGDADLSSSRKTAQQTIVMAEAELEKARRFAEQTVVTAEAESKQRILQGQGEAKRIAEIGQAEADVLRQKIASFMDPKLYAIAVLAEHLSKSSQPLVPEHMFVGGGGGSSEAGGMGLVGTLVNLLVAEKSGFTLPAKDGNGSGKTVEPPVGLAAAGVEDRLTS